MARRRSTGIITTRECGNLGNLRQSALFIYLADIYQRLNYMLGTILGARNKMMSKRSCCVAKKLVLVTGLRSFVHPWLQMTWSLHSPPLPCTQPPHSSLPRWHRTSLQCSPHSRSLFSTRHLILGREAWWKEQRAGVGETAIKKNPVDMVPGPRRLNHVKTGSVPLPSKRLGRAEPVQGVRSCLVCHCF